jgi:hypothetical protein
LVNKDLKHITVWHFCCVATMPEVKQQWLTRQQEMLVIERIWYIFLKKRVRKTAY